MFMNRNPSTTRLDRKESTEDENAKTSLESMIACHLAAEMANLIKNRDLNRDQYQPCSSTVNPSIIVAEYYVSGVK